MHFQPDNAVKGRSECFSRYYNIVSPQERCLKDSWRRKGSESSSIINQRTWKVLVGTEIQILPSREKWLFCYKSASSKLWWFDIRTGTETTNTLQGSGFFLFEYDCVFKFPSVGGDIHDWKQHPAVCLCSWTLSISLSGTELLYTNTVILIFGLRDNVGNIS